MHILILEDEIPAFNKLHNYLADYLNEFSYDWARSVAEALSFINKIDNYTLIIADVQLLDGLSFEVFDEVEIDIPIIFCSAYDEYLFKAFQSNGIAYVLKPYGKKEIVQAIEKYNTLFKIKKNPSVKSKIFKELIQTANKNSVHYKLRFVIKSKKGIHLLGTEKIGLIIAEGDFCKLVDIDGKTHLYSQSIGSIYSKMDPDSFIKNNRSQLVQLSHITNIEKYFKNRLLIKIKGVENPVMTSSRNTAEFRAWIDK